MLLIRLLKSGVTSIVEAYTRPRDYVRPSAYGFEIDRQNMIGDVKQIGSDMREAIKKHGSGQSYKLAGDRTARTGLALAHDNR